MQLRDEVSMLRYRSNNMFSCPMVIRVAIGGYLRGGALYHSQSGESIFAHCPGLRVVYPSTAQDAAGLLRTAIRCDDPVLFLEHKHLYRQTYNKGEYPGPELHDPVRQGGRAPRGHRRRRRHLGRAGAALARWPRSRPRRTASARWSSTCGRSRRSTGTRSPPPCAQTNRVVIAHEDQLTCGFGASSRRASRATVRASRRAVRRVGAMDTPVAYHPDLEEAILPGSADVLTAFSRRQSAAPLSFESGLSGPCRELPLGGVSMRPAGATLERCLHSRA